jgi:integrase
MRLDAFRERVTGLRISELIALKWRCIHADSITVEERYFRGDW